MLAGSRKWSRVWDSNPVLLIGSQVHLQGMLTRGKFVLGKMVLQSGNAPDPSAYQVGALLLSYKRKDG